MIKGYEIERKFLVEFPEIGELDVKKKLSITQTYLQNSENNAQRRVRMVVDGDNVTYTYTEKLFITAMTRREMEYEINENEYQRLIGQARKDSVPIQKIRYCFSYNDQMFDLDTYPFSDKLAIMERELENTEEEINFPDNVKVVREVTGDDDYSNAALAAAGTFPEK